MTWEDTHPDMFKDANPRVFVAENGDGDTERVFVYAVARWYERLQDADTDAVEFSPVSDSESYLEAWMREQGLEMDERDNEFAATVREES
jgi:hypothetical protein